MLCLEVFVLVFEVVVDLFADDHVLQVGCVAVGWLVRCCYSKVVSYRLRGASRMDEVDRWEGVVIRTEREWSGNQRNFSLDGDIEQWGMRCGAWRSLLS